MAYLVDTNILVRLTNAADLQHALAVQALFELHQRGETMHLAPQILIEFRNVATRPLAQNGLGLATADVESRAAGFESAFPLLPETPAIFPAWKALVGAVRVMGKQVHDARLVAICHVHAITHLLTFNTSDFAGMAGFGPGVVVVDPASV